MFFFSLQQEIKGVRDFEIKPDDEDINKEITSEKLFNKFSRMLEDERIFFIKATKKAEFRKFQVKLDGKYPEFSVDMLQTDAFEDLKKQIRGRVEMDFKLLYPEREEYIDSDKKLREISTGDPNSSQVLEIIFEEPPNPEIQLFESNCRNAIACCEASYEYDPVKFLNKTELQHDIARVTRLSSGRKDSKTEGIDHYANAMPTFILAGIE